MTYDVEVSNEEVTCEISWTCSNLLVKTRLQFWINLRQVPTALLMNFTCLGIELVVLVIKLVCVSFKQYRAWTYYFTKN